MTTELQRLFALFHFARDGKTRRQIVRIDLIINLFPVTSLTRDEDFGPNMYSKPKHHEKITIHIIYQLQSKCVSDFVVISVFEVRFNNFIFLYNKLSQNARCKTFTCSNSVIMFVPIKKPQESI